MSEQQAKQFAAYTVSRDPHNESIPNIFDQVDLNDLFADDFFPSNLNFTDFKQNLEDSNRERAKNQFLTSNNSGSEPYSTYRPTDSSSSSMSLVNRPDSGMEVILPGSKIMIPPFPPSISMNEESFGKKTQNSKKATKASSRASEESANLYDGDNSEDELYENLGSNAKKAKKLKEYDPSDVDGLQKHERRERNREHAKRSRVRKRLLLGTLQDRLSLLRKENVSLRRIIVKKIPHAASVIFDKCTTEESDLLMCDDTSNSSAALEPPGSTSAPNMPTLESIFQSHQLGKPFTLIPQTPRQTRVLMEPDFRLIDALQRSQNNFVLSDPSLPDNPIVYCSEGFCKLTGYKRQFVLGRNCRFLQGPGTDQHAVDIIRRGVAVGADISVCLLNYKVDGTPFWNQFFVAALRDADGSIVNFVGVQCEVNSIPISQLKDRVKRMKLPDCN